MAKEKMDRSRIIMGVLLICLGLLFLLNTFGYLNWNTWRILFRFWPLILIVGGLNILLRNTRIWWLVPILVILIFISLIMLSNQDLLPGHFHRFRSDKNYSGSYKSSRSLKEGLKRLRVEVDCKTGKLKFEKVKNKNKLYDINLNYTDIKPEISYNIKDSSLGYLHLKQEAGFSFNKIYGNDWDVFLTGEFPLEIEIDAGTGEMDLDLSKLSVKNLEIDSGVSDLKLQLNNYDTNVEIDSGASDIKIYIPEEAGLRINTSSVINDNNFEEAGLIKLYEDVYQSKNFGQVEHHIKMNISTSASNIDLIYQ